MLDGVFNITGEVVTLLSGSDFTAAQLRHYKQVIEDIQHTKPEPQEAAEIIKREIPALSPLMDRVVDHVKGNIWSILGVALWVFTYLETHPTEADINIDENPPAVIQKAPSKTIKDEVEKVFQLAFEQTEARQRAPRHQAQPHRLDPCPCGSGKRFKNCHGRLS